MRFLRRKDSLLEVTINEVNEQNPELVKDIAENNKTERIKLELTKHTAYKYLVFFVILAVMLCLPDYRQLNSWLNIIYLDFDKSKNLLDQRISNVATIIGVSLTISTILINNLAEKKKENYLILF